MSEQTDDDDGVYRLLDMVVEEVSLVDRAANNRRFLLVKRDDSMADDIEDDAASEDSSESTDGDASKAEGDSVLNVAIAALESLTALVELLGSAGGESDPRVAELAQQLRATAEQILEGVDSPDGGDGTDPSADVPAEGEAAPPAEKAAPCEGTAAPEPAPSGTIEAAVATAKQALERLGHVTGKAKDAGTPAAPESTGAETTEASSGAAANATSDIAKSLGDLATSFRALTETVQSQLQRIVAVEKQVGMPRSSAHDERAVRAQHTEVSWPLDLNQPMDRQSTEKSISFHDV